MKGVALGIDVGTSGVRVAALEGRCEIRAISRVDMTTFGSDRRDPAIWKAALVAALEQLGSEIDFEDVSAVSVDGTSGTVLALDRSETPIGAALMYDDAVDDASIPEAISAAAPKESAAHGPASALARAIVLQDRPGVVRIAHQADWIAGLLAGAPLASDESNALKTGYDPLKRRWPDWIGNTTLDRTLLPSVVPCGAETGRTSGAFGLPANVPIIAGMTDGCASFMATGADAIGDGVTALGTTLTIKLLSDKPVFSPTYGIYSHRIGDFWLAGGASNSGGGALATFFSPERIAELSAQLDPETTSALDYYPLPKPGERFPISDPSLQPRVSPRPQNDVDFLKGLLEGITSIEALGYQRLHELGAPALACLRTVGGGASNSAWATLRERALQVPFANAESTEAAVGVARLALHHIATVDSADG